MYRTSPQPQRTSPVTQWLNEAKRTGQVDAYAGKRRWQRVTWNVSVALRIVSGRDAGEIAYARSRDVSLGGMGLIARNKLALHTEVEICVERYPQAVCGRVVHVTSTLGGYIIGIEFAAMPEFRPGLLAG